LVRLEVNAVMFCARRPKGVKRKLPKSMMFQDTSGDGRAADSSSGARGLAHDGRARARAEAAAGNRGSRRQQERRGCCYRCKHFVPSPTSGRLPQWLRGGAVAVGCAGAATAAGAGVAASGFCLRSGAVCRFSRACGLAGGGLSLLLPLPTSLMLSAPGVGAEHRVRLASSESARALARRALALARKLAAS